MSRKHLVFLSVPVKAFQSFITTPGSTHPFPTSKFEKVTGQAGAEYQNILLYLFLKEICDCQRQCDRSPREYL